MLTPGVLIAVSPAVYWLTFGLVLIVIGVLLARNVYGGSENLVSRSASTLFTVRTVGSMMVFLGVVFCAAAIYHMIR